MPTVFIAGSINIKHLDAKVKECIDKIVESDYDVLVGDADGADTSIQQYLRERAAKRAIVYCSGPTPRNNVGGWSVHAVETPYERGSRAFFTAKDLEMAKAADYGLMIWDAKSTGTLSNVIELLRRKKKSRVFVNKDKAFKDVGDVVQLEQLVARMSDVALKKADVKIHLLEKINSLKIDQPDMFAV